MANMITCPYCGGSMAKEAATCPSCGGPVKKDADAIVGNQPYFGGQDASVCPGCNARVGSGDIVCTNCGTNLLTGEKAPKTVEKEPVKRDLQGVATAVKTAAIVLLVMVCGGALFLAAGYLLRDPVGNARREAQAGNLEQASALLRDYLQGAPSDMEAQFLLGQVYWQGQQYNRAWEAFESVARQGGPRDREAAMFALMATERLQDEANRQRQIALLRSLIEQRYPDDVELLTLLATVLGVQGEYAGYRDTVERLRAMGAELPSVLPGLASALSDDLDTAERRLQQAFDARPDDGDVAVALGLVQKMRGQDEAAVATLENATAMPAPLGPLTKMQLGALFMQRGQFGRALPLLTEAKRARPDDERAAFLHALCLQKNRLQEEALVALESIASGTSVFAGKAALEMAVIYLDQEHAERAATYVRRAGEAGVTTARQATIHGRVHTMQGNMSEAEQAYRRAISMQGNYPAARLELGLMLINRGAIEEGLQELERYLELTQDQPAKYRANEIEVLITQIRETVQ